MTDLPTGLALACLLLLTGLAVGSFLNVVIWRVPRGESTVRPPSACPSCGAHIRPRDNVPVVSWLLLRGRCRDCGAAISLKYPLVELATGGLFILVGVWICASERTVWALPAYLLLAAVGIALVIIDVETHRLPNRIVFPAFPAAAALLGAASLVEQEPGALVRAAVGGAVLWGFYFLLLVVYPKGMGFGDVKLAGLLGLYLGWWGWGALVVGAFAAFLVGGLYALALIATGRANRKSGIPFGPWMVLGAALGLAVGETLWAAYLGFAL